MKYIDACYMSALFFNYVISIRNFRWYIKRTRSSECFYREDLLSMYYCIRILNNQSCRNYYVFHYWAVALKMEYLSYRKWMKECKSPIDKLHVTLRSLTSGLMWDVHLLTSVSIQVVPAVCDTLFSSAVTVD